MNHFTWENLKTIYSSKFTNSMYIWIFVVPIFVKIFELVNKQYYEFIIFNQPILIQFELPFTLIYFYFSAILFALGNIIFKVSSPLIIRENNSYADFREDGKRLLQLKLYSEDISYDLQNLVDNTIKEISEDSSKPRTKEEDRGKPIPLDKLHKHNYKQDDPEYYFWQVFDFAKNTRKSFRQTVGILYILGFTLFFVVLVQNFITITDILLK